MKTKLGKMIEEPTPKCRVCKTYVTKELNLIGTKFLYKCRNCNAVYEIVGEQVKEKVALKNLLQKNR